MTQLELSSSVKTEIAIALVTSAVKRGINFEMFVNDEVHQLLGVTFKKAKRSNRVVTIYDFDNNSDNWLQQAWVHVVVDAVTGRVITSGYYKVSLEQFNHIVRQGVVV